MPKGWLLSKLLWFFFPRVTQSDLVWGGRIKHFKDKVHNNAIHGLVVEQITSFFFKWMHNPTWLGEGG
jgi:hypothetical protein